MVNSNLLKTVSFTNLNRWSVSSKLSYKMKSKYPLVSLSQVMKRIKEPILVENDKLYKRITVRLYGLGVLQRDELYGKDIGTKKQFIARKGQLIISRIDARNGAFGIVPDELDGAIVTNDFWLFDVKNAIPQYLSLVLSSQYFQKYWESQSSGTTNRQRVDEDDFLMSKIALPSIDEQFDLINQYEKRVGVANDIVSKEEQLQTSIFDYLTEALGIVETKSEPAQMFSTVKYSTIDKWGVDFLTCGRVIHNKKFPTKPIASVCDSGSGGTPSRSISSYYGGDIPWIKTGEVLDDIIYDTEEKITQEAINNSSAKLYPKGSIVIAMYGQGLTRGRTAKLGIDATTNQASLVLYNINTDKVLPDYLWYYLQGEYHRLRALAYGNNQPNLNAGIINNYPIVLPPIKSDNPLEVTQTAIVKEIVKRKEQIKNLKAKAKELKEEAQKLFEEAIFGET